MSELISADACRKYAEICRYRHSRLMDIRESNMFQALEQVCLQAAGAVGWEADAKREMGNAGSLRSRLAELERNEGTLLGMIRHQQDVLRECLPYVNESMAGRRPGRSADDIRAAVKALTTDSATHRENERG